MRQLTVGLPDGVSWMAVLKADGYGHGATMCLPVMQAMGLSMVGVASIDEALQLREAGVELPILILGGVPDWSIPLAVEHNLQLSIFYIAPSSEYSGCLRNDKNARRCAY